MLSDGFYLTRKIDNALLRDTPLFLAVIGRESMHAARATRGRREISKTTFQGGAR